MSAGLYTKKIKIIAFRYSIFAILQISFRFYIYFCSLNMFPRFHFDIFHDVFFAGRMVCWILMENETTIWNFKIFFETVIPSVRKAGERKVYDVLRYMIYLYRCGNIPAVDIYVARQASNMIKVYIDPLAH